jgi:hypothetical protein
MHRFFAIPLVALLVVASCSRGGPPAPAPVDRRLAHTAQLELTVDDPTGTEAQARTLAEELGGFVGGSSMIEGGSLALSLRVPDAALDEALRRLGALGAVTTKRVQGTDVTLESVDLESQEKNLLAARARLVDLLSKTSTATEALEVSRALVEVQGQLEQVQGRLLVLTQRVAMATLDVTFAPRASAGFRAWRPLEVAAEAAVALGVIIKSLANLVIVLVVLAPLWGPLALFIWRRARAARRSVGTDDSLLD